MRHTAAVQHSRTLDVLRDVRARFQRVRGQLLTDDVALGEEYDEALGQLDDAITAEVRALNALEAAVE